MKSSKAKIVGWVLSGLLALMLIGGSAISKFAGKAKDFEPIGFSTDQMFKIGIVEILITVLFLIPRTAFLGAILLTGYLGGATVTHFRVGESVIAPVVIGIIVWISLGLRQSAIFRLAMDGSSNPCPPSTSPPVPPAA